MSNSRGSGTRGGVFGRLTESPEAAWFGSAGLPASGVAPGCPGCAPGCPPGAGCPPGCPGGVGCAAAASFGERDGWGTATASCAAAIDDAATIASAARTTGAVHREIAKKRPPPGRRDAPFTKPPRALTRCVESVADRRARAGTDAKKLAVYYNLDAPQPANCLRKRGISRVFWGGVVVRVAAWGWSAAVGAWDRGPTGSPKCERGRIRGTRWWAVEPGPSLTASG
jgi:hypothetical protein